MRYLGNAISFGMLDCLADHPVVLYAEQLELLEACQWVAKNNPVSCVGHEDTALLLSSLLMIPVEVQRVSITLNPGDQLLVGQYNGPRLPQGTKALPKGARLRWILIDIRETHGTL